MNTVNHEQQRLSIRSLESTYNKLLNAYKTMTEKGANTTLVQKRRDAIKIAVETLKGDWVGEEFRCDAETLSAALAVLESLLRPIEIQIAKAKEGSSGRTLNERRLVALRLAIESLRRRQH